LNFNTKLMQVIRTSKTGREFSSVTSGLAGWPLRQDRPLSPLPCTWGGHVTF
jgi:hypothetical protein